MATATSPAPAGKVTTFAYSLPPGAIPSNMGGGDLNSRFDGVLSVPATPGPHPVAFVVHGTYATCLDLSKERNMPAELNTISWPQWCGSERTSTENFTQGPDYVRWGASWAYLTQELAAHGIAAVAIDVRARDETDFGEGHPYETPRVLVDRHRSFLADLNQGVNHGLATPDAIKGSLDTSQIALIGHSSGGEFALSQLFGVKPLGGVKAVVGLQPAFNSPVPDNRPLPIPAMFVAGECDEQVPPTVVAASVADVQAQKPTGPFLHATVPSTTHLGLLGGGNTKIGKATIYNTPGCAADKTTRTSVMRSDNATLIADFLTAVFAGKSEIALRVRPDAPATITVISGSMTVKSTPTPDEGRAADVGAKSITYVTSTERYLPVFTGKRVEVVT